MELECAALTHPHRPLTGVPFLAGGGISLSLCSREYKGRTLETCAETGSLVERVRHVMFERAPVNAGQLP